MQNDYKQTNKQPALVGGTSSPSPLDWGAHSLSEPAWNVDRREVWT